MEEEQAISWCIVCGYWIRQKFFEAACHGPKSAAHICCVTFYLHSWTVYTSKHCWVVLCKPHSAWLWGRADFSWHSIAHHMLSATELWSGGMQTDDMLGAIMMSNFWFKSDPDGRSKCRNLCPAQAEHRSGLGLLCRWPRYLCHLMAQLFIVKLFQVWRPLKTRTAPGRLSAMSQNVTFLASVWLVSSGSLVFTAVATDDQLILVIRTQKRSLCSAV